MRYLFIMTATLALLTPSLSQAHRDAQCDGQRPVRIQVKSQSIVQIKTTEAITGVYPATPQPAEFIAWDKGHPQHLFRIDASKMSASTDIHVNTTSHQCLLQVRIVKRKWDSMVTLTYPPTALQIQASLPPSLRESPVRQMWFAMWLLNKADAPATVKLTKRHREMPSWIKGLTVALQWQYTMPGFEGFTQLITNTSATPVTVRPEELHDPHRPIHSVSITDTMGGASWRPGGTLIAGESALLHIVYRKEGR